MNIVALETVRATGKTIRVLEMSTRADRTLALAWVTYRLTYSDRVCVQIEWLD